ncbi:twin-arginine translocase subunit TatC [Citricoccus sp. NR2]|uniref:twin-arginine translocase subunit TatC n=1 Tax=Citricoccus sp. NR2 TaxID=3004095 RepID=UPI0022DD08AD|nr:twin-arginine translocase subunit TatC [Citricoccus sp. NR2]WBL18257.1 twin-arginine translocase subunit TatC [Citricoccus sp. NR2]
MTKPSTTPPSRPERTRKPKNPEGQMSLRAHLKELRNRLIKAGLAIAVATIGGFFLYKPAFSALTEPVTSLSVDGTQTEVVFSSVAQPFDIMLQVALFIGLVVSSPVWLYQLWAFIVPGLQKNEKRYALAFIAVSVPLFVGGVFLGWIALPQALQFFVSLTPSGASNFIQVDVYVPFVLRLLLAFGVALLLPVLLVGLNMLGVLSGKTILKHWRISVFVIAVIAAMGAPGGDIMTMFYLGGPMAILFAIALGLCLVMDRRRAKKLKRQADTQEKHTPTPLSEI